MRRKKKTTLGPGRKTKKKGTSKIKLLLVLVIGLALWIRFKPLDLTYPSDSSLKIMEGQPGLRLTQGDDIRAALSKVDSPDAHAIMEGQEALPTPLFLLAGNEPESIPFVADYLRDDRDSDTSHIFSTLSRSVPYYCQWDSRWGYEDLAGSPFALSGCGPTSMAMVISGLKSDPFMTPDRLIETAEPCMTSEGVAWDFIRDTAKAYRLKCEEVPLDRASINAKLEAGVPLVLSVRPGDFTLGGHIMVMAGLDQEGYYIINDPNSIRHSKNRWTYERLAPQIKNIWAISK